MDGARRGVVLRRRGRTGCVMPAYTRRTAAAASASEEPDAAAASSAADGCDAACCTSLAPHARDSSAGALPPQERTTKRRPAAAQRTRGRPRRRRHFGCRTHAHARRSAEVWRPRGARRPEMPSRLHCCRALLLWQRSAAPDAITCTLRQHPSVASAAAAAAADMACAPQSGVSGERRRVHPRSAQHRPRVGRSALLPAVAAGSDAGRRRIFPQHLACSARRSRLAASHSPSLSHAAWRGRLAGLEAQHDSSHRQCWRAPQCG
jgi:hypothetical protein